MTSAEGPSRLPEGLRQRPMVVGDLEGVLEVEGLSYPIPWDRSVFERELRNSWSRVQLVVEEASGRPLAHAVYWIVHDELHLLNLAVHPEARGRGLARVLMEHLMEVCAQERLQVATLEVRVGNVAAIGLYRAFGFTQIGLRKGYYADNREDAMIMGLTPGGD